MRLLMIWCVCFLVINLWHMREVKRIAGKKQY